jgi:hypothetical protein
VGQELECSLAGGLWLRFSHDAIMKVSPQGSAGGEPFPSSLVVIPESQFLVEQPQFLAVYWLEAILFPVIQASP